MGCKREEKWHSHLIRLQISGRRFSPRRRKTAPAAERGDEKRHLGVTRRAPPPLLRRADSGKTPLLLGPIFVGC